MGVNKCVILCTSRYSMYFHCPKNPLCSSCSALPWQPLIFLPFHSLAFPECHTVEILQQAVFSNWLLSLSNMPLRFLRRIPTEGEISRDVSRVCVRAYVLTWLTVIDRYRAVIPPPHLVTSLRPAVGAGGAASPPFLKFGGRRSGHPD